MKGFEKGNSKKRMWVCIIIAILIISASAAAVFIYEKYFNNKGTTKCENKTNSRYVDNNKETKVVVASTDSAVNDIKPFLDKAGWSLVKFIKIREEEIPLSFEVKEDELPYGLIWAYNNELSKAAGLDFSGYKGRKVKTYTMLVKSKNGDNPETPCNIIICDEKIIGAWFGNESFAGSYGFGKDGIFSMSNESIETLAKKLYKNSYSDNIDKKFKNFEPKEILETYFEAINKKDYKLAYYLLDVQEQIFLCLYGEKKISDKLFQEDKIALLELDQDPNSKDLKFENEFGEKFQTGYYSIKANGRFKNDKEDMPKRGGVQFVKRGDAPWKIGYLGWEAISVRSIK